MLDRTNAMTQKADDSEIDVGLLVEWFEDSVDATEEARKAAERDRDYYDGAQLTSEERETLRKRGQPDVIVNRIQPKIDYLLGFEAATRTDPRAFPRTPKDEPVAHAATDALRFLGDKLDLAEHHSAGWENMMVEGFCGLELTVDEQGEIGVEFWPWDRLFFDPHSRKHDFSDARYVGGIAWLDEEDVLARYPDAADVIAKTKTHHDETFERTYDDRPAWRAWVSGKSRKRIRLVQIYYRHQGAWHYCVYTQGGKLDSYPVPFVDSKGMSWCPLIMQSAYVNRDNDRYGIVRIMISPQDEINKRRSKALHMLTMRQSLGEEGSVDDVDALKRELSRPDGHVKINPGFRFELLNTNDLAIGHINLLQEAKNEIELLGPNAAMLGKDDNAPSGRAILANQQGGQTELTRLLDRHRYWKRRIYERLWDLVRQYKTEEWWIRVTDDENNVKFVGLNRPITVKDTLVRRMVENGVVPSEQEAETLIAQMVQTGQANPLELEQVIGTENQPSEIDVDITLEEVSNVANLQQETFEQLVNLANAGITFPPDVYIRASSLRNKDELLESMQAMQPQPTPMDQANLDKTLAEIEKIKADTEEKRASIPSKATDTMKTMAEAENLAMQPAPLDPGLPAQEPAGVPFDPMTGLPAPNGSGQF